MAAEIIEFAKPDSDEPHLAGDAICMTCGHKWPAVAPVGTVHLTCPRCDLRLGVFKNAVEPESAWACNCSGNQLFFLTRAGAMCRMCGLISSDWAE